MSYSSVVSVPVPEKLNVTSSGGNINRPLSPKESGEKHMLKTGGKKRSVSPFVLYVHIFFFLLYYSGNLIFVENNE